MSYRPITDKQAREYPYRVLIEHSCDNCGCGFSSVKPAQKYCSHQCYIEAAKEKIGIQAKALWRDQKFRDRIKAARLAAGYPDPMREEAVAKRKLRTATKNSIQRCIRRGAIKSTSTIALLGYSIAQFRAHIESLFQPGMTWANYGEWEIDHRRPIADFPITAPLSEINALSNLQPLWRADNRRKRNHVWV